MSQIQRSLDELGLWHGTDKASSGHGYLDFYERFFEGLRDDPITILEIGVFKGASLKTWESYFPRGRIIGADIDPGAKQYATSRITIERLDQSNCQDLVDLGVKHGPFDIIIEDGSHLWEHQITTLKALFPFLKSRGYYVVEDLQTNFGANTENYRGNANVSCVDYLKRLLDLLVADQQIDISAEDDPFLRTYGRSLSFLAFHRHACLIEKRLPGPPVPIRPDLGPLVTLPAEAIESPFRLLAHIGQIGDVENAAGPFITAPAGNVFVQGFQLSCAVGLASRIRYRGRLPTGAWTDWVPGNGFAGSRGQNSNLTGFTVEVSGEVDRDLELVAIGRFAGEEVARQVGNGQDCLPIRDESSLQGMQLVLMPRTR
jgi:hypothetical protein